MYDRVDSGIRADNVRVMEMMAYSLGPRMNLEYLRQFNIKLCNIK
jgi:hypothetical protein